MNPIALFLLSASLVQAPASAPRGEEPSVVRTYDLRAAVPAASQNDGSVQVFPLLGDPDSDEFDVIGDDGGEASFLTELIYGSFEQEFEYEGREVYDTETGTLVVRGPEHLQRRIAALLAGLSQTFWASTEVTIDVVSGRELPERMSRSSVLDEAEVRPFLDEAQGAGALERYRLPVGPGRPAVVDVGRRTSLLADYDVEVAEGALIWDPTLLEISLGNRMGLRVAPGSGGLYLALDLRRALPLGPQREETHASHWRLTQDGAPLNRGQQMLTFQRQDVVHRSLALSSFLPDGKVLVVASRLDTISSNASELIFIRRSGAALATHTTLEGEDGAPDVHVIDQSSVHVPACSSSLADGSPDLPPSLPNDPQHGWELHFYLKGVSRFGVELGELLRPVLDGDENGFEITERWPWMVLSKLPHTDATHGVLEDALRESMPASRVVQVRLTLRKNGQRGAPLARMSIPARVGEHSAAVLGTERQLLHDNDVEIAKYSAVEDPILKASFAGLIVDFEPRLDPLGGIVLDLRALASQADGGVTEVDVEPTARRLLQQQATNQLLLRQLLHFAADGGGARRVFLGDAGGSLVLEVEVDG